ncbi:hypothetical protein BKA93DRAFT_755212 [Sparassis latifolia]
MQSSDSSGKVPQDIIAIFHAAFHPTQGNIIDWSLKASDDLDLTHVEFSCLPSGLHLMERDVVYFTKDDHAGVCVFQRRQTSEHGHRGFRLSSLGILLARSTRPRPWRHVPALKALVHTIYSSLGDRDILVPVDSYWDPARAFFAERQVHRADLGGAGDWNGWTMELDSDASYMNPTMHLAHILRILGPSCLTLYKHVLGRRRILIYTLPPVEAACILCQIAADICYEDQKDGGVSGYSDEDVPEGRLKGKCKEGVKVLGVVTLNDLDKLDVESKTGRGWIACTTDALFLEKPAYYDLVIDLRTSTPNTRPTFYVPKLTEPSNGRGPSYRLSVVRFTWSDVKLWTELDRLLQLDSGDCNDVCCDATGASIKSRTSTSSSWTDIWRVYEDVCVMCAGLWMGSWRGTPVATYSSINGRSENWGSIRLEGNDDVALRSHPYVRSVGMGIEGRPAPDATTSSAHSRPLKRTSGMSIWTLTGSKGDPSVSNGADPSRVPSSSARAKDQATVGVDEVDEARRDRRVLTTLALLQTFHSHTTVMLVRLADLLPRRSQSRSEGLSTVSSVLLTPKDVMSFELGPFSALDARFVEWLADEYSGGIRVIVRRSWRDLVGLILGFG